MVNFMESEPIQTRFELIIDWIMIFLSSVLIVIGGGGLLVTITLYSNSSDTVLQYGLTFVYTYMLIFGIILMKFHNKVIVKRY